MSEAGDITNTLPDARWEKWRALAAEFGTPLAVYDVDVIRRRCRELKAAFSFCDPFYSVKANHSPALLQFILGEGFGVDAVSPNEVALALRCGASPHHIVYVENNMTDAEMEMARASGVRLVIGSLSRLGKFARRFPGSAVGIRINADIGSAHHARAFTAGPESKFGVHFTGVDEALRLAGEYGVRINLLQQHIGSGWLDESIFAESVDILLREARRFPDLETLDFGGGFGVPYQPGDRPLALAGMAAVLRDQIASFEATQGRRYKYAIEPGRFIVAESAVLLATVQDKKAGSEGRTFLGLDTGFNHLMRPALYGSVHEIVNISSQSNALAAYDICGNICESTDFFARGRELTATEEGDILAVLNYGAYGAAMSSAYNLRPPVPEVFVDGDRHSLTRKRATLDDLIGTYIFDGKPKT
jgi:diaminopimelate decarboxylase